MKTMSLQLFGGMLTLILLGQFRPPADVGVPPPSAQEIAAAHSATQTLLIVLAAFVVVIVGFCLWQLREIKQVYDNQADSNGKQRVLVSGLMTYVAIFIFSGIVVMVILALLGPAIASGTISVHHGGI